MLAVRVALLVISLSVAVLAETGYSTEALAEPDQIRQALRSIAHDVSTSQPSGPQNHAIESFEEAATELAKRLVAKDATPILEELVKEGDRLALLTLAKLQDQERARQSLYTLATDEREPIWVFAALYAMPPDSVRELVHGIARDSPDIRARVEALRVLGEVGDKESLDFLKATAAATENTLIDAAVSDAVPKIEAVLRLESPEQRARWRALGLRFWWAVRHNPGLRTPDGNINLTADYLAAVCGEFPTEFLALRGEASDGQTTMARAVAARLLGLQKRAEGVPLLMKWAADPALSRTAGTALTMLEEPVGRIALEKVLESQLEQAAHRGVVFGIWGGDRKDVVFRLIEVFRRHGTAESAAVLDRLAEDERYPEDVRERLRSASDEIQKRHPSEDTLME